MVSKAVKIGSDKIIKLMMNEGIDVSKKSPDFALTPMGIAANRGYSKILELLVDAYGVEDGISNTLLHASFQDKKTEIVDYKKCFEIIAPHMNVNDLDDIGNTPLHHAVNHRNHAASLILMKKNSFINAKNMFNESPLDAMTFELLEEALDDRVTLEKEIDKKQKSEKKIRIDFNLLLSEKKESNIEILEIIAENSNLRPLITHGVISTLIYLKLKELKLILYTNFLIFGTLFTLLIAYIVMCHTELRESIVIFNFFKFVSYFGIFLLIIREFTQLLLCLNSKINYFKSAINIFEIFFIILAILSLVFNNMRGLHILTILCATIEILHLMNELPNFWISCHIQILKKVAITFLKSLALYSIILISFAMSFFILFSKNEPQDDSDNFTNFAYPGIAIIRTFVMLTGEFDAASLSLHDRGASYSLMLLLFIFTVTIVLLNLLSALAFNDTQKIKTESELYVLCSYLKILRKYERILMKFESVKNLINFNLYDDKIIIQPSKGYLVTSMSDNEGRLNDTTLETGCINSKIIKINYCNRLDKEIGQKLKDIVEFNEEKKINEENENFLKAKIEAISGELHQLKQKMTEQNEELKAKIEKAMVIMVDKKLQIYDN